MARFRNQKTVSLSRSILELDCYGKLRCKIDNNEYGRQRKEFKKHMSRMINTIYAHVYLYYWLLK